MTKKCKDVNLTVIAAKDNNSIISDMKSENCLKKAKVFLEKSINNFTDFDKLLKHRRSMCKNFEAILLIVDFSKAFNSIHKGKMVSSKKLSQL